MKIRQKVYLLITATISFLLGFLLCSTIYSGISTFTLEKDALEAVSAIESDKNIKCTWRMQTATSEKQSSKSHLTATVSRAEAATWNFKLNQNDEGAFFVTNTFQPKQFEAELIKEDGRYLYLHYESSLEDLTNTYTMVALNKDSGYGFVTTAGRDTPGEPGLGSNTILIECKNDS